MTHLKDRLQDEFTSARVNLVFLLQEEVDAQVLSLKDAIKTFSKLTLLSPEASLNYIRNMTNPKVKHMWTPSLLSPKKDVV